VFSLPDTLIESNHRRSRPRQWSPKALGNADYRRRACIYAKVENNESVKKRFFDLLARIEGGAAVPRTDAIDRFTRDETLEELVAAIERDITANKPAAALDRLHTYCMKKFGHLLDTHGVAWDRKEPLHSRAGKYVKALETSYFLRTHRARSSKTQSPSSIIQLRSQRRLARARQRVA
jgi:hypothetical protein